jgi:LysM repeat protein
MRVRQSCLLLLLLAVLVALGGRGTAAAQAASVTHTVKPGENLFRIALYYGTTVDAIQIANGLGTVLIYVGQQLVIPGATNTAPPEAPLTPPPDGSVPGEPTPVPTPAVGDIDARTYVVQAGDTLTAIAARFDIAIWELRQFNGLLDTNMIIVGQELVLSSTEAEPVAEPEPVETPTPAASEPPVATATPEPAPPPDPETSAPVDDAGQETYTVQRGDNLTQIAARFGMTVVAISRLNGIANPSQIYIGQVLRLTGTAPAPSGAGKLIVVDLSDQHMWAYEGDQLVYSFVISTGAAPSYTVAGEFRIQSKIPNAYASTWDLWMPHWMGIYWAGSMENGIHALPILSNGQTLWAGYLGTPISYGCIVLGTQEAAQLYNWAVIGTPLSIRY